MEPPCVSIDALPDGNYSGHWAPGKGGTKQLVVSSTYSNGLAPEYRYAFDEPADYRRRPLDYRAYDLYPPRR
jgi:hypothetical protein